MQTGKFVRLPAEVAQQIEKLAQKVGVSQSSIIRDCVLNQIASKQLQQRIARKRLLSLDSVGDLEKLTQPNLGGLVTEMLKDEGYTITKHKGTR